ncbi:MAG: hypothetical protein D6767_02565 [Candidatus Hydrogenedentota bacterium]|nr:MAG: hypothetical protein D6767_02565 [Candidatus Hydrogenedentota bacterium]
MKPTSYLNIFESKSFTPKHNLQWEEECLTQMEKNPHHIYLLFYENLSSIILGKTLHVEEEVYTHKKNPPILRRMSGGGSVYHHIGNLNYSIILSLETYPHLFPIHESYRVILSAIVEGMKPKLKLVPCGLSDLAIWQKGKLRKISGNAQARKRGYLMHHGTFLYKKELLNPIRYYLRHPKKEPDYRESRKHDDFLIQTLPQLCQAEIKQGVIAGMKKVFQAQNIRMFSDTLRS